MKKTFLLFIVLTIVMSLTFTSCTKDDLNISTKASETSQVSSTKEQSVNAENSIDDSKKQVGVESDRSKLSVNSENSQINDTSKSENVDRSSSSDAATLSFNAKKITLAQKKSVYFSLYRNTGLTVGSIIGSTYFYEYYENDKYFITNATNESGYYYYDKIGKQAYLIDKTTKLKTRFHGDVSINLCVTHVSNLCNYNIESSTVSKNSKQYAKLNISYKGVKLFSLTETDTDVIKLEGEDLFDNKDYDLKVLENIPNDSKLFGLSDCNVTQYDIYVYGLFYNPENSMSPTYSSSQRVKTLKKTDDAICDLSEIVVVTNKDKESSQKYEILRIVGYRYINNTTVATEYFSTEGVKNANDFYAKYPKGSGYGIIGYALRADKATNDYGDFNDYSKQALDSTYAPTDYDRIETYTNEDVLAICLSE